MKYLIDTPTSHQKIEAHHFEIEDGHLVFRAPSGAKIAVVAAGEWSTVRADIQRGENEARA